MKPKVCGVSECTTNGSISAVEEDTPKDSGGSCSAGDSACSDGLVMPSFEKKEETKQEQTTHE